MAYANSTLPRFTEKVNISQGGHELTVNYNQRQENGSIFDSLFQLPLLLLFKLLPVEEITVRSVTTSE